MGQGGSIQGDTFQSVRNGLAQISSISDTVLGPYATPIKAIVGIADVILSLFQQCAENNEACSILKVCILLENLKFFRSRL